MPIQSLYNLGILGALMIVDSADAQLIKMLVRSINEFIPTCASE